MSLGLLPPALAMLIAVSALMLFAYARRGKAGAAVQLVFAVYAVNYAVFAWAYGNPTPLNGYVTLLFGALEGPAIWWLARSKANPGKGIPHWGHLLVPVLLLAFAALEPQPLSGWPFAALSATRLAYIAATGAVLWSFHTTGEKGPWFLWVCLLAVATGALSLLKLSGFGIYVFDNSWRAPLWLIVMKSIGISAAVLTLLWWALIKPEVFLGHSPRAAKRSATDDDRALYDRFRHLMESDQVYLQEELKVSDVAEKLAALPRELSEAINRSSGNSFKAEIRRLRVAYACNLLRAEPNTSVLEIAHRSGFATKSVFNTAFKTETGLSPTAYRKTPSQP